MRSISLDERQTTIPLTSYEEGVSSMIHNFSIHDFVNITIEYPGKQPRIKRNLEYYFYRTSVLRSQVKSIHIRIMKERPKVIESNGLYSGKKYVISEDSISVRVKRGTMEWTVKVTGLDSLDDVDISVYPSRMGIRRFLPIATIENLYIYPLLFFQMLLLNKFMVHAGAVSNRNGAYIFSGESGSYKTSLILGLLKRGEMRLLADDKVIIGDNEAIPYLMNLPNYAFIYRNLENEDDWTPFKKLAFYYYLLFSKEFDFSDIPIGQTSPLRRMFHVERRKDVRRLEIIETDSEKILSDIAKNSIEELKEVHTPRIMGFSQNPFWEMLSAFTNENPDGKLSKLFLSYNETFKKQFAHVSVRTMVIPDRFDSKIIDDLVKILG